MRHPEQRGFTLIEVVVALAILGIGMLAVFKTIGDTVNNVDELRDRSFAEWIADNRITEVRISGEMPSVEETAGEVEFAGRQWHWLTKVSQTQVQGLRRIDVSVRRDDDPEDSSIVTLSGFVGADGHGRAADQHRLVRRWLEDPGQAATGTKTRTRTAERRRRRRRGRRRMKTRRRQRGFTLLEILVAIVILAVMGVMAYRGVAEARVAVGNAEGHLDRLRHVQRTMQIVVNDFPHADAPPGARADRRRLARQRSCATPTRSPSSSFRAAGWPNGAGTPRGTVQRVVYRLEDGKLVREHWTVMDATLATPPVKRELIDRVERVEIRYLTNGREWIAEWPQFDNTKDFGFYQRPLAVEITLVLEDYGEIRRLVEVSG